MLRCRIVWGIIAVDILAHNLSFSSPAHHCAWMLALLPRTAIELYFDRHVSQDQRRKWEIREIQFASG